MNFSDILKQHSEKNPDNIWLFDGNTGEEFSFSYFDKMVDSTAFFLQNRGVKKGNVISVVLGNKLEYLLVFFASIRLGAVFNPFPNNLNWQDLNKYFLQIDPDIVILSKEHYQNLKESNWKIICIDGDSLENIKNTTSKPEKVEISEQDIACIYYSSGTTDNPKGVVYTHSNMYNLISSLTNDFNWKKTDKHLVILPLGHTAAINYSLLPMMFIGGKIILYSDFWKIRNDIWDIIIEQSVTYVEVVPSILFTLINLENENFNLATIKQLKYIGCGSAPLPLEVQNGFYEKFGIKVANLYGLSETGPSHIDNPLQEGWKSGSIGVPISVNEVKILDEKGNELGQNEIGEIAVKGKNVFTDYYKNTKQYDKVVKNGFFRTGDLGYIDQDGKHYFVGRIKDLIIKGGVNISPDEIDEILFKIPQIKECVTVGEKDDFLGEKIVSYVVLNENQTITRPEIIAFCRGYLSPNKIPNKIEFIKNIPKTASGKLLRKYFKKN